MCTGTSTKWCPLGSHRASQLERGQPAGPAPALDPGEDQEHAGAGGRRRGCRGVSSSYHGGTRRPSVKSSLLNLWRIPTAYIIASVGVVGVWVTAPPPYFLTDSCCHPARRLCTGSPSSFMDHPFRNYLLFIAGTFRGEIFWVFVCATHCLSKWSF